MPSKVYQLFHWTPAVNLRSIRRKGLDPAYSTGKRRCIWTCDVSKVAYLRDHIALHHETHPADLILLRVEVTEDQIRRSPWEGIYWIPEGVSRGCAYPDPSAECDVILGRPIGYNENNAI